MGLLASLLKHLTSNQLAFNESMPDAWMPENVHLCLGYMDEWLYEIVGNWGVGYDASESYGANFKTAL